jgi:hypothetical protein
MVLKSTDHYTNSTTASVGEHDGQTLPKHNVYTYDIYTIYRHVYVTIFTHLHTPCAWSHILFDHGKFELQDKQHDDKIIISWSWD